VYWTIKDDLSWEDQQSRLKEMKHQGEILHENSVIIKSETIVIFVLNLVKITSKDVAFVTVLTYRVSHIILNHVV